MVSVWRALKPRSKSSGSRIFCCAVRRAALAGARLRHRALAVVFVEPFERARAQLLADELVDRAVQQARIAGELLGRVVHAARGDHGRQIVGAEVLVDELLRRALDQRRAQRVGVQVVEHDDVQPPLERLAVGLRVRRNDALRVEEALGPLDRDVDLGEQLDLLRLAVLEDLEVVLGQPRDEVALRVGDERVHLDVVDLGLEGDGRRRLRAARARGLTGLADGRARGRERGRPAPAAAARRGLPPSG